MFFIIIKIDKTTTKHISIKLFEAEVILFLNLVNNLYIDQSS
jgi:hypothetical protein